MTSQSLFPSATDVTAPSELRTRRSFVVALGLIAGISILGVAATLVIRSASDRVTGEATPRFLAAQRLQYALADMNGAQNLYVLDHGASRDLYLRSHLTAAAALAAAGPELQTGTDRALLRQIVGDYHRFTAIDARVFQAVSSGDPATARTLAIGPETVLYDRMAVLADQLSRSVAAERSSAINSLDRIQTASLIGLALLGAFAFGIGLVLYRERRRVGSALAQRTARLAESDALHRSLIAQMPAITILSDLDARIRYVSPQSSALLGVEPGDLIGRPALDHLGDLVHPDDADLLERYRESIRGVRSDKMVGRFRDGAGGYRWLEIEGIVVTAEDGRAIGRQAVVRDVSEHIEMRHTLVEEQTRHRTLVEQLPLIVWRSDRDGKCEYVSPAFEKMLGYPPSRWLGRRSVEVFKELADPDEFARVEPEVRRAIRDGQPIRLALRIRRADGEWRWLDVESQLVLDERGESMGAQGVARDVTESVLARRELDEQRQRYQTLVENMPAATFINDEAGDPLFLSRQVEAITGVPVDRWYVDRGQSWIDQIVHPDDRDRLRTYKRRLYTGAIDRYEMELRMQHADGSWRTVVQRETVVRTPDGRREMHGIEVDVTAEREAQQRSREALTAIVRTVEEEQARIAVELHDDTVQVMTALLITLRMVKGEDPRLARFETMLADALERTRRLMFELRPQILERDGLGAAITELAKDGPWTESIVEIDAPRQSETLEALVYRTVREIVINARKHSRAERLSISGHADDQTLVLEIVDDGVGFDVGRALDRDRMRMHLGLDTMIERVRIAGGDLTVESTPGEGARFRLTVRAEPRAVTPEEPAPRATPQPQVVVP